MSPGYFETVIADYVRVGGTIYVPPTSAGGAVMFTNATIKILAVNAHVANTNGPVSAGWSGGLKVLDLGAVFPGVFPTTAKAALVRVYMALDQPAGAGTHEMSVGLFAQEGGGFNLMHTSRIRAINPTLTFVEHDSVTPIPLFLTGVTDDQIQLSVNWPNVNPALAATQIIVSIVGYLS